MLPPEAHTALQLSALSQAGLRAQCLPKATVTKTAPWAKIVCRNRSDFVDCGLQFSRGPDAIMYKFLFPSQTPQYVALCPMKACHHPQPAVVPLSPSGFWQLDSQTLSGWYKAEVGATVFDSQLH